MCCSGSGLGHGALATPCKHIKKCVSQVVMSAPTVTIFRGSRYLQVVLDSNKKTSCHLILQLQKVLGSFLLPVVNARETALAA